MDSMLRWRRGMASKIMTKAKPRLYLLGGTRIEAEHVAALFHALTGRVTTPAQVEECRQALDQAYERLAATQSVQEGGCMPASDDRKKVAPANDQREGVEVTPPRRKVDYGQVTA